MTQGNVWQFSAAVDAVLSQNPSQHGGNLRQTDPAALYQAADQLDVTNRCTANSTAAIIVAFLIKARSR